MKQLRYIVLPVFALINSPYTFAEEAGEEATNILPTLRLTASDQHQKSYRGKASTAATKFASDPMKMPQQVQVVSSAVLKDINAQRIADTLAMVSGVSALNPMSGFWDNYSIRGFNTDQTIGASSLRNGINANLGLSAPRDMVNVDAVEFLKGPEAALYGAGDPGGTLNVITKKPEFNAENNVTLRAGSYDQYRVAFDSTNALTDTIAYRLGVSYTNNQSFRDYVKNNRLFIAPQLTWKPTDNTQIDYDSEYSRMNNVFDRGVVAVNQQLGVIPISRFLGEPNDGSMAMNDYLQQLRIQHQFENGWKSNTVLNFKDNTWTGFSSEAYQLLNSAGDLNRERRYRKYNSRSYLVSQELSKQFSTGNIQHHLNVGLTASTLDIENYMLRFRQKGSSATLINIYHPVYGVNIPNLTTTSSYVKETQNNLAFNVSDLMELNADWTLLLGGRFDLYQQKYQDLVAQSSGKQNFNHFSPKVALNYSPQENWSVFVSAGQSFHLNSGLDINHSPFKPETAWTYELGSKWKLWDDRLSATASIFHISKENVLTTNPQDSSYMVAAGEEKSRGFELDVDAQPLDRLNLKLAYTYTNAYVSKSDANSGIPVGARLLNSPKHSANFLAMYDLWQSGEQKVGVGGNVQYVSARAGNTADDGFELPSYTLLNLNAYYQHNANLRVQFTLNNVLDKTYYVSSIKDVWVTPGNPREAFITVDYKF
ncbi:MAG: TonB-dependent siderophore receptor [Acinetobacter sp.]